MPIIDSSLIRQQAEIAVETTCTFPLSNVDHLCCGNLGRLETLLCAAQRLARPSLLDHAQQGVSQIIAAAQRKGGYALFANLPREVHNFGLYQGLSGIGYELLRIASPDKYPSILLWETQVDQPLPL